MAGTKAGKGKRGEQDGWLERQNRALRDRGYKVSLDLHQGMVRLRATLPPKSSEPAATPWKQCRISTGLRYPDQALEAVTQAESTSAAKIKPTAQRPQSKPLETRSEYKEAGCMRVSSSTEDT